MCLDIHFQNIKKWNKIEIIVKNEQLGLLGSFFLLNVTLERRLRNKIRSRECWPTEGELSRLFDLSLSFSLRLCIFLLYFEWFGICSKLSCWSVSSSRVYWAKGRGDGRSCPHGDLWPANQCSINDRITLLTYKKRYYDKCTKNCFFLCFLNIQMYTFCFNSVLISNTFLFFVKKKP